MKKKIRIYNLFIVLVIALISRCSSEVTFKKFTHLNNWGINKKIFFNTPKIDTTKNYNLYLYLRNNREYVYSNIFLIVKLKSIKKTIIVDTLEYQMTDANGKYLGKGFSHIKEHKLWWKENYNFTSSGPFQIEINQAVRGKNRKDSILKGIVDVGISIE